jgi:hypothetical protein
MLRKTLFQSVEQKRAERSAEPLVRGNIEAYFLAIENRLRQFVAHQLFQQQLLA